MVPEIISFSKSMSCRLQEFQNLLSDVETPCSEIKEVWSSIFHDLVIPTFGWQALWVLSEESCCKYDLIHPTAVIVTVEDYDWDDMSATVTITAVQDDIVLPSVVNVPVIELHPLKHQEYDTDDLTIMADWLDKCRYFFKYLWYPWDAKISVKLSEWCILHLENRLQIQCDIQNGLLERNVVNYYKSLVAESKKIDAALSEDNSKDLSGSKKTEVISNCIRRKVLKTELSFFEEPDLRYDLMLLRKKHRETSFGSATMEAKFVWEGGNINELMLHLSNVKSHIGDAKIYVSSSFQDALDSSTTGNMILLPPGSHSLKSLTGLESGGIVKGLGNSSGTEILADYTGTKKAILFECFGDFSLENVSLTRQEGIAIQAFGGTLRISNCRLQSERSSSARGIVILSGCNLILENCEITGFCIGIALQKGATASIFNTRISDCGGGIKMSEKSSVSLKEVEISQCCEYAVRLESTKDEPGLPVTGDLDLLPKFASADSKLEFESVVLSENKKYNVLVDKSWDFASDTFDGDDSVETIVISDEDICEVDSN